MIRKRTPGRASIGGYNDIKKQKRHFNRVILKAVILVIAFLIIILYLYQVSFLIAQPTFTTKPGDSQDEQSVPDKTATVDSEIKSDRAVREVKASTNGHLILPRKRDHTKLKEDINNVEVENLGVKIIKKKDEIANEYFPFREKGEREGEAVKHAIKNRDRPVLKAYIEHTNQKEWDILPLPTRTTKSTDLKIKEFPEVSSCTKLTEQWPIDEEVAPTNLDPFLPWIHDVFPTADGKFIQFVAQNKRRCQTGRAQSHIKEFMQPNVALFQHVPVKRIDKKTDDEQQRYRLSTHEEADEDGIETRFICRFKPSMEETLSVFNFNYDYNSFRKAYTATFTKEGFDVHIVWNSQHLFRCPVPESLQDTIRSGSSVLNDYATQFVDLIPIRTPPRYIYPNHFLPPRFKLINKWNATAQYGSNHILPRIEDSGRLENIPICKPSLMTYPDDPHDRGVKDGGTSIHDEENDRKLGDMAPTKDKKHKLIACAWTSAGFHTRGGHTYVDDGSQRLLQWLMFNKLVGVDHVYIYDNSASPNEMETLKPITDLFPGFVTRINWPSRVCNNNSRQDANKGERSSQYAAESSCRLRFGAHSDWLSSFDTDEYPVPMASYNNLKDLLDDMEKEDMRIINFASMRSKPRLQLLNSTRIGKRDCFDPTLPENKTFLEVYNCNRERPPRKALMAAEKQIYRTDYVLLHFVHYSAITTVSAMSEEETKGAIPKEHWKRRYKDLHTRYTDEITEATMLHTKAIVEQETCNWEGINKKGRQVVAEQRIGIEFPPNAVYDEFKKFDRNQWDESKFYVQIEGKMRVANCFPIKKIDEYWVPKLNAALDEVLHSKV